MDSIRPRDRDAGWIFAVNRDLLTKVVARALPFQFTTEPETTPEPFTVSVNPAPPGLVASGNRGWLISGTGFAAIAAALSFACSCATNQAGISKTANKVTGMINVSILLFMASSLAVKVTSNFGLHNSHDFAPIPDGQLLRQRLSHHR